jgi:hypothetical protein
MHKKRHHIVPLHYLKGFTIENSPEYIWRYEKYKKYPIELNLKDAAVEKYYYSYKNVDGVIDYDTIENYLAEDIENPAVPVLNKLRNKQHINDDEKYRLSRYMAIMLKRVPKHRQKIKIMSPKVFEEERKELLKIVDNALNTYPEKKDLLEERRKQINDIIDKYKDDLPDEFYVRLINDSFTDITYSMNWRVIYYEGNNPYITSDSPCFFFDALGLARENSEITFPINRSAAIWAGWTRQESIRYIYVKEQVVKEVNRRSVYNAYKYIYSPVRQEWINKLVNKKSIRLLGIK